MTYNVFSGTLNPTHVTSRHVASGVAGFLNLMHFGASGQTKGEQDGPPPGCERVTGC